ncbi:MAG TPA: Na-translocating system protein MpsC family protein [Conexibacter sp.]|nr:Na-translocating system protein MpsC family protein [Conexibacter sp.]
MTGTQEHPPTVGLGAAISNAVVRLLSEYTGRGPTKARTYINDDYIAVVLQDTLTKGERSLVRDGRTELVLDNRKAYQQTMANDLVAAVEELSGRTVHAFLSDNHADPDVAVESFVLAPRDGADPTTSA